MIGNRLIGGVDGIVTNDPVTIPGVLGNAVYFDSLNDSLDLGIYP